MKFSKWFSVFAVVLIFGGIAVSQQNAKKRRGRAVLDIPKVEEANTICFALYTVSDNTLKLTAQLYPLEEGAPLKACLEIEENGAWKEVASTEIIKEGWTAPFRVETWDDSKTVSYRVIHG
ncbi:MAG TPA: hypothetical protein DDW68_02610, partial [Verrucomicrobiales bacterium]|nr:hypothetical protein [Verrucomicrobiales bacterium]